MLTFEQLQFFATVALGLFSAAAIVVALIAIKGKIPTEDIPGLAILLSFSLGCLSIASITIALPIFFPDNNLYWRIPTFLSGFLLIVAGAIEYNRCADTPSRVRVPMVFWPLTYSGLLLGLLLIVVSFSSSVTNGHLWFLGGILYMLVVCIAQIVVHFISFANRNNGTS